MLLTLKREKSPFGMIGIGILSALAHNSGQLLAACIMTGSMKTLAYAPALTVFALISGSATGAVYGAVYRRIHNMIDNRGLFEK